MRQPIGRLASLAAELWESKRADCKSACRMESCPTSSSVSVGCPGKFRSSLAAQRLHDVQNRTDHIPGVTAEVTGGSVLGGRTSRVEERRLKPAAGRIACPTNSSESVGCPGVSGVITETIPTRCSPLR